jgi:hypothetical protein
MSCNKCNKCNPCDCKCPQVDCGCKYFIDSLACIRHDGPSLDCLDINSGQTLEEIILAIDSRLCQVQSGDPGLSAYDIAVENGFEGTEQEWLDSLVGEPGECDCDGPTYTYFEAEEILADDFGNWSIVAYPGTLLPVNHTPFNFAVPSSGLYEVQFQTGVAYDRNLPDADQAGIYIELRRNNVKVPNSSAFRNDIALKENLVFVSLFKSNINLIQGELLSIAFATNLPANIRLVDVRYKITKIQ